MAPRVDSAPEPEERRRPRVVIVGGGFGGLAAARALDGADLDVLLLDARNHHCFQPLLYQAATAALSVADIAWPIRYILARQRNATVLMATVNGVDADRRVVSTSAGDFGYDWLVLATGSTHSYFGHDAWEAFAPSLKTIEDAVSLRSRMLSAFERAEAAATEEERKRCLVFAIVGGGATGVELAGALAELARRTLPPEFRRARPACARILLLEAGPRLLPTFPQPLATDAERRLARMGVEVRTGAKVDDVREGSLVVGGERSTSAARSSGPPAFAPPPRPPGSARRPTAAGGPASSRTFRFPAGRRCSSSETRRSSVTPTAARSRGSPPRPSKWGATSGRTIRARSEGRPAPAAFCYRDYGNLATIGRNSAIASIGRLELTGLVGWLFWSAVHIYFLIGLRSRFFVAMSWAWSYLTDQRGARLILPRRPSQRGRNKS